MFSFTYLLHTTLNTYFMSMSWLKVYFAYFECFFIKIKLNYFKFIIIIQNVYINTIFYILKLSDGAIAIVTSSQEQPLIIYMKQIIVMQMTQRLHTVTKKALS